MLYQDSNVNNKTYVEKISTDILEQKVKIDYYGEKIRKVFNFKKHFGQYCKSLENEKPLCRNWFNEGFPNELNLLGAPIDYESSLIEVQGSKVNIDLVSYNLSTNTLFLIEVKGTQKGTVWETSETLLRAALEIETYYLTLKENERLECFICTIKSAKSDGIPKDKINGIKVKKVVVLPSKSDAYKMYKSKEYPKLNELIEKLSIDVLAFDDYYVMKNV